MPGVGVMFERFTERAREVCRLAREESQALSSGHIAPGHLLLGLLREDQGLGARALNTLGVEADDIRAALGEGNSPDLVQVPFTKAAQRALELALREALSLGHNYIGTEHILLGVARGGFEIDGPRLFTLDAEKVREVVIRDLSAPTASANGSPDMAILRSLARRADELATELSEFVEGQS